jgi:segregation and condensation protein A
MDRIVDLGEVTLADLLETVREVLSIKPPQPSVNGAVPPIKITMEQQMDLIERRTSGGRPASFRKLLTQATSRIEIIVTLLALLEMVKQLRVSMRQSQLFDDILIERKETPGAPQASPRQSATEDD